MAMRLCSLLVLAGFLQLSVAAIPSYIKICKRNNPNLDQCIIDSINSMSPKLMKGIPELDIPTLDPMFFEELILSTKSGFKAIGKNVIFRGATNSKIINLKADIKNLAFLIELFFPNLAIDADYDVNMKLLSLNLKGKGPLKSNHTDVTIKGVMKGHKVQKDKGTYLLFDTLDLNINLKSYNVRIENLFGGDKALGEAVNIALNENKKELINLLRPKVEKMLSRKLLSIANKITQHFTFEELFPEK